MPQTRVAIVGRGDPDAPYNRIYAPQTRVAIVGRGDPDAPYNRIKSGGASGSTRPTTTFEPESNPETEPEPVIYLKKKHPREITISAVGDFTLASNYIKPYSFSFYEYYDLYGPEYFCENIRHIFIEESDYTIANLECVLSDNDDPDLRLDRQYSYKGYSEYTGIITAAGINAVNLANNHTFDYSQEGYDDTVGALDSAGIGYFGNNKILIEEINGVKVGFAGFIGEHRTGEVKAALEELEENGAELKIVSFHWGSMDAVIASAGQAAMGRFAIDNGADLVIGHHPHVLQGIEEYNGRYIIYSLGNFIFDGNVISDIENRTSVILQQRFVLYGEEITESEINLIPIFVTSNFSRNNFKPMLAEGERGEEILRKIGERSVDTG
ncbi:MAG: CapA family protein [Oscillospiraceae bacterium]|nr:CapA family protein [Oscillospiraceae bacterium]